MAKEGDGHYEKNKVQEQPTGGYLTFCGICGARSDGNTPEAILAVVDAHLKTHAVVEETDRP